MSMHNEDHWSDAEIPIHYPDDVAVKTKRLPTWAIAILVIAASGSMRMLPGTRNVTPTGISHVTIVDEWESLGHLMTGEEAVARTETYVNGVVRSGPLENGKAHGTWESRKNGETTDILFYEGKQR